MLPREPNDGLLLVRTDYSDEDAWRRALARGSDGGLP